MSERPPQERELVLAAQRGQRDAVDQRAELGREAQRDGDGNFGAYMWQNGVVTEVVGFGAPAPDADGLPTSLTFDELRGPIANGNGDIAVLGHTSEGWGAYLLRKGGKLVRIAAKGKVAALGCCMSGLGVVHRLERADIADRARVMMLNFLRNQTDFGHWTALEVVAVDILAVESLADCLDVFLGAAVRQGFNTTH